MPKRLTPQSTLDSLKRAAKRWLKAVREGDAAAIERLRALLLVLGMDVDVAADVIRDS